MTSNAPSMSVQAQGRVGSFGVLLQRRAPVRDSLNLRRWTLSMLRIYIDEYAPGDNSVVLLASQPTIVRTPIPCRSIS